LVLCTPLYIYWPKPVTSPPPLAGETKISKPRLDVITPPQSSAREASKISDKSARIQNPFTSTWKSGPQFKAGDHVALYGDALKSIVVAKDLEALKVFTMNSRSEPPKRHDKTTDAFKRVVQEQRLGSVPVGSICVVVEIHGTGGVFSTAYAVRSLLDPSKVFFVQAPWVIPASQELENIAKLEDRVGYLKSHVEPYQSPPFSPLPAAERTPDSSLATIGKQDTLSAAERLCAAVLVENKMESEAVAGDNVTGISVERDEKWDRTTTLLTLRLESKTLFLAYTTTGPPPQRPCEATSPVQAFLCGQALPREMESVVFSGTPLPECRTSPVSFMYQWGFSFTLESGGLYNLIKQDKTIPIMAGTVQVVELRPADQALIELFLRAIEDPARRAREEPIESAKPAKPESREVGTDHEESDDHITLLDVTWERRPTGSVKAFIRVKNTTRITFKGLKATFMFETASGSLLHTENSILDPPNLEPGDIGTTDALVLDASTDIDHFTLKFEADDKNVKFKRR
jgi:hypothetical protein